MAELKDEAERVLRLAYPGSRIALTRGPNGRVSGVVEWQGFQTLDHVDRQRHLAKTLRESIDPALLSDVGVVLTLTPDEAAGEEAA